MYTEAALLQVAEEADKLAAEKGRATVVRLEGARGYCAGAYLRRLPGDARGRKLPDGRYFAAGLPGILFRLTLTRHLQLPYLAAYAGQPCPLCGGRHDVDADGDCAEACVQLNRGRTPGHNLGRDAVCTIAADAQMRPRLEVTGLVPGQPKKRPADVLLPATAPHGLGGAVNGLGVCIDCTHVQLLCPAHIGKPSGAAATAAWQGKLGRTPPPGFFMYPLAWDSCGGWHKDSLKGALDRWAAHLMAGEPDEDDERGIRSASRLLELKWQPRLSAAAHRGAAQAAHKLLNALRGEPPPPYDDGGEEEGTCTLQRSDYVGLYSNTRALVGSHLMIPL